MRSSAFVALVLRWIGIALLGALGGALVYGGLVRVSESVGLFVLAEGTLPAHDANQFAVLFGTWIGAPLGALLFPLAYVIMRDHMSFQRIMLVALGSSLSGGLLGALLSPYFAGITGAVGLLGGAALAAGAEQKSAGASNSAQDDNGRVGTRNEGQSDPK